MNVDAPLTREQQAVVDAEEEQFVVACPGAGKTRVVAERFARIAKGLPRMRGVAIVSFTRNASEEILKRSHRLLGNAPSFPHFIGTSDAFINRYLVLPFAVAGVGGKPQILDSYARLEVAARPRGLSTRPAAGLTLDELVTNASGETTINVARADRRIRTLIAKNAAPWINEGIRRRTAINRAGYLSCDDARLVAMGRIRDAAFSAAIGPVLRARFAEIIIDEAQDCSADEIEMCEWFRRAGIPITIVCDPDQAIFEFRDAKPELLLKQFSVLAPATLTINFRSTANICRAAAAATPGRAPAVAAGTFAQENAPVLLIASDVLAVQVEAFSAHADRLAIPLAERVILAHQNRDVATLTRDELLEDVAELSRARRYVAATRCFRSTTSARERQRAVEVAEHLILDLIGVESVEGTSGRRCERANLDPSRLRRQAHALLTRGPLPTPTGDPVLWRNELLRHLTSITGVQLSPRILPVPSAESWSQLAVELTGAIRASGRTIHQAKGSEADAVLLSLPFHKMHTPTLVAAFDAGFPCEALRVLYVGMTRARRLLAVGVGLKMANDFQRLLASAGAEVRVHTDHSTGHQPMFNDAH